LVLCALAGVETGILGGLAMLGWLAASSALDRQSIWIVPNLLGSVFYGRDVLRRSFGWVTMDGLALHFFVSGLIGLAFGLSAGRSRNRLRVALLGIAAGLVWYYFSEALFWRKLGVVARIYGPPRSLLLAHLIYGLILARFPSALASLERHVHGEPVSAPKPLEP